MHCHTIASGHAYSSLQENVKCGKDNGLQLVGISDHASSMPGSPSLLYFQNMRVIPREIEGIKVMMGVEANIIDYNGNIDMPKDTLKMLDYSIASMHPLCIKWGSVVENTRAIIKAIQNPYVNIIGHPDDSRYEVDYKEIVKAAKDYNVLLEINNSSLNPKGFRRNARENIEEILELCQLHNTSVILGSDAHVCYHVGDFNFAKVVIKETNFPAELVVNDSVEKLNKYIDK
jgi:putative hydrolase